MVSRHPRSSSSSSSRSAVIVLVLASRRASRPTGSLSRETRERDQTRADADAGRRGVDVDRARGDRPRTLRRDARRPSSGGARAPARRRRRRVRAGRRGRARRHPPAVPQPRHRSIAVGFGLAGFGAGDARLPLAAQGPAGFGGKIDVGKLDRHPRRTSTRKRSRSTSPRPAPTSSRTRRHDLPDGEEGLQAGRSTRAWSRASSRSTRSACTSAAACRGARRRSGSSARATARSTTGSARRRPARRRAVSTASHVDRRRRQQIIVDTGDDRPRPADRHQHDRSATPKARLCV